MKDKIQIWSIRRNAISSLSEDQFGNKSSKRPVFLYYYLIPVLMGVILPCLGIKVNENMATYFITGISIFSGLFFNLLLIVSDKLNERREKLKMNASEEQMKYVLRFRKVSEQLISQISYAIILSIGLIILLVVTTISFNKLLPCNIIFCFEQNVSILTSIPVFVTGFQFLIFLLVILSGLYSVLLDDLLNRTLEK